VARVLTVAVLGAVILGYAAGAVFAVLALVQGAMPAIVGMVIALGVGLLCVAGLRGAFRRVDFYEGGAVETLFGRQRVVLYQDVTQMQYSIIRQYINGAYAGTNLNVQLRTADGRKLGYGGRYSDKLVGRGLFKAGRFEGTDPMDVIRAVVSQYIAARMTEALARGETVRWPGVATISAHGLTPMRGRRKGTTVGWSEIAGMTLDKGVLHLFAKNEQKSFLDIVAGAVNVYPAMEVIAGFTADAGQAAGSR
jgi:hypothetical protein